MSTVSTSKRPIPPLPKPDPYRYGWRYVRVEGPDGSVSFDQVPLTLEDVLFPEVGDFIVQADAHIGDWTYLRVVFKARLAGDPAAVVITDCRVDWNIPGVRPLGPDFAVFFDVKQHRDWATLDVAAEGARPVLVVEITSPDTRQNDLVAKVDYYYRAGVPLYVITDAKDEHDGGRRLELIAYRHTPAAYERIAPMRRLDLAGAGPAVAGCPARPPAGPRPAGVLRPRHPGGDRRLHGDQPGAGAGRGSSKNRRPGQGPSRGPSKSRHPGQGPSRGSSKNRHPGQGPSRGSSKNRRPGQGPSRNPRGPGPVESPGRSRGPCPGRSAHPRAGSRIEAAQRTRGVGRLKAVHDAAPMTAHWIC